MAKLELQNEPISCAKALISYFALYFPEKVRKNAFSLSANSVIDKDLSEFFEESASQDPFDIIVPLTCTFDDKEKEVLTDLRLFKIFNLLFSDEVSLAERASLISTFRVLRKSYCDCYESDKNVDKNGIKRYIEKSYELYCEVSQSPPKIDWSSENFIGSYTQKIDLKKINQILKNPTGYYTQKFNLRSSSVNADYSEKTLEPSSEYEIDFYSGEKIPTDQFGFTESQKLETFLKAVYNGLKELDFQNLGLLSFPKEDSKPSWEKNEETGKLIAPTCSEENFVNMFEGVSSKTHPMRTISCARGIHLSAFITAFANPYLIDCKRDERRGKVQRVIKSLVYQPGGKPFNPSSLQKNGSRYDSLLGKYRTMIDNAMPPLEETNK